jgi:uncharacterized protein with PQ loop repeat
LGEKVANYVALEEDSKQLKFLKRTFKFDHYITCVAMFGNLLYYVQAYEIFKNQSASSVSWVGFTISTFSMSNWLAYGLIREVKPLVLSSGFGLIGNVLVLMLIYVYRS